MTNLAKKFVEEAAPEYWYSYAQELAETANAIYEQSKRQWIAYIDRRGDSTTSTTSRPLVSRPVLLLYGLSFENLIKGILISEHPELLEGGKLHKKLLGHDLVALARRMETIPVNGEDETLLALLSDVVPYHGRYPVPRRADDLKPERYITEEVYTSCTLLFQRLEMHLYRLNIDGMPAPEGVHFPCLRLLHLDDEADFVTEEHRRTTADYIKGTEVDKYTK
ncbi:hypothetical protein B6V73_17140 [Thioclava sp. JM3]|uniref:hypothetical protein n=1 Tax=Thioclava sp. JM3 TaxID=1973004 RepID=UPI000B5390FC|nr:hypothetical protein [Thioclava sp. JM3]OWY13513.1 hypothetical protein B6V73_17140 [Thioclava sp. JM3]